MVWSLASNVFFAILRGDWKVAQEFIARSLAESPRDAFRFAQSAQVNLQVGNIEESSEYINRVLEVAPDVLVWPGYEHASVSAVIPLFAQVTGTQDRLDIAESAAKEILSSPSTAHLTISLARAGLALIAIQRGDAELAREQYSLLKSEQGTQIFGLFSADRVLGLLAHTLGNLNDSQTHFEDASTFCRKAGYHPELAWSLHDYADMLLERDNVGDKAKATSLLDESLQISTDLGMRPLVELVLSKRDILKA